MFSNTLLRRVMTSRIVNFKKVSLLEDNFAPLLYARKRKFKLNSIVLKEVNNFSTRPVVSHEFNYSEQFKEDQVNSLDTHSELVQRLRREVKLVSRVAFKDLNLLLHILQKDGTTPSNQEDLLLLECCSDCLPDMDPLTRLKFVNAIWGTLKKLGVVYTTDHYITLLKNYAVNKHRISAQQFLNNIENVIPDKRIYEFLLHCVCINGDIGEAIHVVQQMKENNVPISEFSFNSLILGHARAGDIKSALSVLNTMRAAKLELSASTFTALLQSYGENGDFEGIKTVYEREISDRFILSDYQVMNICESLGISGHHNLIPEFLELLPDESKKLTPIVYNSILSLIYLKREESALTLLMCVSPFEIKMGAAQNTQEHKYAFFVNELCKADVEPSCIIKLCSLLEEKEVFPRALLEAAHSTMVLVKPDLTSQIYFALVQNGVALRPHYFWPLFKQRALLTGESGVFDTLKEMQDLKVSPDFHTLMDYILPVVSTPDPQTTIEKLKKYNIPVRESLTPVAASLVNSRRIKGLRDLCQQYSAQIEFDKLLQPLVEFYVVKRNVESIVQILQPVCKNISSDLAGHFILELLTIKRTRINREDIFRMLKGYLGAGIFISSFAAEIITQHLKNGSTEMKISDEDVKFLESVTKSDLHISPKELFDDHIPHPRDMNLEELECHFVELKAKNMNTRGALRRLLQLNFQKGNVERVQEIQKELEDSGFKVSPGMLSNLFALYVHKKDIPSAQRCLSQISNIDPNFLVDEFKIINYAILLATNGQYKAAVSALENRAGAGNISGGNNISHNCWELLSTIAMQGEPEQAKHMLHLLKTLGFCTVSNTLLGPLVRAHLQRGDIEGAIREYVSCCKEYKKTPLLQELFNHLVSNASESSGVQLQEVMAASNLVHGQSNTDIAYIVALANAGKKNELHKFIQNNGQNLNYSILINRCNRLASQDKFASLAMLSEALRVIPHFNIGELYNLMLKLCDKNSDCNTALQLWTEMQECNIVPSEKFRASLASLLQRHNQKVPFALPK